MFTVLKIVHADISAWCEQDIPVYKIESQNNIEKEIAQFNNIGFNL